MIVPNIIINYYFIIFYNFLNFQIVTGINEIKNEQNTTIFHSGTAINNNEIITTGGRVLGVTSIGNNINEATNRSYEAIKMINFEGAHFRKDIAKTAKDFIG